MNSSKATAVAPGELACTNNTAEHATGWNEVGGLKQESWEAQVVYHSFIFNLLRSMEPTRSVGADIDIRIASQRVCHQV